MDPSCFYVGVSDFRGVFSGGTPTGALINHKVILTVVKKFFSSTNQSLEDAQTLQVLTRHYLEFLPAENVFRKTIP